MKMKAFKIAILQKQAIITHPVNINPSMTFQKESGKEGLKILLMLASVIIITAGLQAGNRCSCPSFYPAFWQSSVIR